MHRNEVIGRVCEGGMEHIAKLYRTLNIFQFFGVSVNVSKRMTQKSSILNWMSLWQICEAHVCTCVFASQTKTENRWKKPSVKETGRKITLIFLHSMASMWYWNGDRTSTMKKERKKSNHKQTMLHRIIYHVNMHRKNEMHLNVGSYESISLSAYNNPTSSSVIVMEWQQKCKSITEVKFSSGLENYKHHETTIDKVCVLIFMFVSSSHLSLNKIKYEKKYTIECAMCRMYCWHAIIWLLSNILCREMYTFLHHTLFVCVLRFFVPYIYLHALVILRYT